MSNLDLVSRVNADYVEDQYRRYRADPNSVDERWALFFAGFEMADGHGNGANGHAAAAAVDRAGDATATPSRCSACSVWSTPTASSGTWSRT